MPMQSFVLCRMKSREEKKNARVKESLEGVLVIVLIERELREVLKRNSWSSLF